MKGSFLSIPNHLCAKLEQYVDDNSTHCSDAIRQQWLWSNQNRADSDKMCSLAQLSWLKNVALDRKAERILDIGCYSGLSAMAWYEGTSSTHAEILTIDSDPELVDVATKAFDKTGYGDRIKIVEGWASDVLPNLTGKFDIIFVDIAFDAYKDTVRTVLDKALLAPDGVILVDNVFARGFVADDDSLANIDPTTVLHWRKAGAMMRDFNSFVRNDPRVLVSLIPIFDGISDIRWNHAHRREESS